MLPKASITPPTSPTRTSSRRKWSRGVGVGDEGLGDGGGGGELPFPTAI